MKRITCGPAWPEVVARIYLEVPWLLAARFAVGTAVTALVTLALLMTFAPQISLALLELGQ